MRFLDSFPAEAQTQLLEAGRQAHLEAGEALIRRGEKGGDFYLIEAGAFEVVDTRSHPEIVLDVVGPGDVLGELTFVDDAPRGADVRASEASTVRVWSRADILARFDADPHFAAAFYRAVARTLSVRFRTLSGTVSSGGFLGGRGALARKDVAERARELASQVLRCWVDADERLRHDSTDKRGRVLVGAGLQLLLGEVTRWLVSLPGHDERRGAGELLARELRPYLNRAVTGERTLDALGQAAGDPRLLAHIIRGEAAGDGTFGHVLDSELLALPTMQAVRSRVPQLVATGRDALPAAGPTDLLMVHPNCGAVLIGLLLPMSAGGGRVRIVDSNRSVLGLVDVGLQRRPPGIGFTFVQADLAAIAMGRVDIWLDTHQMVVLDGILDHLPDRLAITLLSWAARHLAPGGTLMVSGLAPTPDTTAVDYVLGWPLVRRDPSTLARLVGSVRGLTVVPPQPSALGIVLVARSAAPS